MILPEIMTKKEKQLRGEDQDSYALYKPIRVRRFAMMRKVGCLPESSLLLVGGRGLP